MSIKTTLTAAAAVLLLTMGVATAQTAAPAAPANQPVAAKPAKVKKAQAPRTQASLKCSADATAQGLKGKPRKSFMNKCKSAAKKAAAAAKKTN